MNEGTSLASVVRCVSQRRGCMMLFPTPVLLQTVSALFWGSAGEKKAVRGGRVDVFVNRWSQHGL